jgi:hypothetical protein
MVYENIERQLFSFFFNNKLLTFSYEDKKRPRQYHTYTSPKHKESIHITLQQQQKKQYQLREAWLLKRPDDIKQISFFTKLCNDTQVLRVSTDTDKPDHVFMS